MNIPNKPFEKIKLTLNVDTGYVGASHESKDMLSDHVDKHEWENMNDEEKEEFLSEVMLEFLNNTISYDYDLS